MKKSLFLAVAFATVLLTLVSCSNVHYGGKDTHKVYGNGVWASITTRSGGDKIIRGLNNRKYNEFIVDEIIAMEESDDTLYVYGTFIKNPVYAIIYLTDNKVKLHAELIYSDTLCMTQLYNMIMAEDAIYLDNYDDFSDDEKKIFDKLKLSSN